jgi:hypothetical protein
MTSPNHRDMPIEIKELHIKVKVAPASGQANGPGAAPGGASAAAGGADLEAIIAACVEQVMQILKDKQER